MYNELSAQEVYDTVVRHLAGMTKQSKEWNGLYNTCKYRDDEGNSCAVGCLIHDDEYDPAMDGADGSTSVAGIYERNLLPHRLIPHISLLTALQTVHDSESYWDDDKEDMKARLLDIAVHIELDAGIITQVEWK